MRVALGIEMLVILLCTTVFIFNHSRWSDWRRGAGLQVTFMAATAWIEALVFILLIAGSHLPVLVFAIVFGLVDLAWIGWVVLQWRVRHRALGQTAPTGTRVVDGIEEET